MAYYLVIVFALYFLMLIMLMIGLSRAINESSRSEKEKNFISIVVAVRNEENNLPRLLKSIIELNYDQRNFEMIVVDDHSEDKTLLVLNKFFQENNIGQVISLAGEAGKKAALTFGISRARGTIIATTDADCVLPREWLQRINQMFNDENLQLCVGSVKINDDGKFFSSLQSMEFASVIGTGAATLGWRKPTMCNGANLSFRKKAFEQVNGYEGNFQYASGDDQFLMAKINHVYPNAVSFMPFRDSVVSTQPLSSLLSFFSQRIRWAGKWSAMSVLSKALAIFTFFVQVSWIILILSSFNFWWAPVVIVLKLLLEFIFLAKVHRFLSLAIQPISFLLLQFVYAPYVIGTAIFSQFNAFVWKGRRHAGLRDC